MSDFDVFLICVASLVICHGVLLLLDSAYLLIAFNAFIHPGLKRYCVVYQESVDQLTM